MADKIEEKALALHNEVRVERGLPFLVWFSRQSADALLEALCRAIEAHEADKQAFSDMVEAVKDSGWSPEAVAEYLTQFIIKKPDPLVEAVKELGYATLEGIEPEFSADLTKALAARGLKIVEANNAPL